MKISELKQPYRRMAEYLAERNNKTNDLGNAFDWHIISYPFWNYVNLGKYPPITSGIKREFPSDFDFSEEIYNDSGEKIGLIVDMTKMENKNGEEDFYAYYKKMTKNFDFSEDEQPLQLPNNPIIQNRIYTQLAKEGKFDQLPATCEFSEPVELEVWDDDGDYLDKIEISGKYKGYYIDCTSTGLYSAYQHAQLPTKKIDFTQFQTGDVVEVELVHNETKLGWFDFTNENHLYIRILKRQGNQTCNGGSCAGTKIINKEKIKSITKIK